MKNVQTPHRQGPRLDLNFKYEIEMDEERHSLHYRPQARVKCKDLGWNIQFGTGHATTEGLWFNNLFSSHVGVSLGKMSHLMQAPKSEIKTL